MSVRILTGDVREVLKTLPDESVHCVVTSPPYWGLRNYDMPGQIGLEPTMAEHLVRLVAIFRDVRRVLRKDGTFWLNYGDGYAGSWGAQSRGEAPGPKSKLSGGQVHAAPRGTHTGSIKRTPGLKPKDRMMLPARLAIALCDDGWWIRDEVIWHKSNAMPGPKRGRTTLAHEMLYMLSKSRKYHYDHEAIAEDAVSDHASGNGFVGRQGGSERVGPQSGGAGSAAQWTGVGGKRIKRSVWTVATEAVREAHFATFPQALITPCILAGCPKGGTVLDPFFGSGTTGIVASRYGRDCIGIELNPNYSEMARRRVVDDSPLFAAVS